MGAQYAMRIWIDPFKLTNYGLAIGDVKAAIQAQNAQVSAGQVGSLPADPGQALNATITAQSRLRTPEEFRRILLRTNPDGSNVYLSDVERKSVVEGKVVSVRVYLGGARIIKKK